MLNKSKRATWCEMGSMENNSSEVEALERNTIIFTNRSKIKEDT